MIECLTPWYLIFNAFAAHNCGDIYSSLPPSDFVSFSEYYPYFLKTFILELPIYYVLLRRLKSGLKVLEINLLVNLATHPFIFLLLPVLLSKTEATYLDYLLTAEVFAPAVEALLLAKAYKIPPWLSVLAAVAANLFSWSIGVYWL